MNYEAFKEELKSTLERHTTTKMKLIEVDKNNGITREALVFYEEEHSAAPTIYLKELYQNYKNGMKLEDIVKQILELQQRANKLHFDALLFTDFERAKERIFPKIINFERNIPLLNQVPHKRMLDLAVVFYYAVPQTSALPEKGSILIKSTHLGLWNISIDELYDTALKNAMEKEHISIKSMQQIVAELFGMEEVEMSDLCNEPEMFVLSNESHMYGAAAMLQQTVLKEFAEEKKKDVFILPSSIHELILIPMEEELDAKGLKDMVSHVNLTTVAAEEQLSNQIYYFHRVSQKLSVL